MKKIVPMVDLQGLHRLYREQLDAAWAEVMDEGAFIQGPRVHAFRKALEAYTGSPHVVACANGTDALQIALMALGLQPGDEVLVPAFTYIATAEVVGLLNLTPVMVDVEEQTFNVTAAHLERGLSSRTKAVMPVHLFGQSCDMGPVLQFAKRNGLFVVEDNAQSLGAEYIFPDGTRKKTGTMGNVGCTSFFPTKNLGCMGDGGAMMTSEEPLARKLEQIANHGQEVKYHHEMLGCNSRLDTLQAALLEVKLRDLDQRIEARYRAAQRYHEGLKDLPGLVLPVEMPYAVHTYNQFTVRVPEGRRDALREFLTREGIATMIYYPLPLQAQRAFRGITRQGEPLEVSERLCREVLSLPMHALLSAEDQEYVMDKLHSFFRMGS